MDLLSQIADFLENNSLGEKDNNIHPGRMPSSPDNSIAIVSAPGNGPHKQVALARISFQIKVRNNLEPEAIDKSWKIYKLLTRRHNLELITNGIILRWCYAEHTPHKLGVDENNRTVYITNYEASVYESHLTD